MGPGRSGRGNHGNVGSNGHVSRCGCECEDAFQEPRRRGAPDGQHHPGLVRVLPGRPRGARHPRRAFHLGEVGLAGEIRPAPRGQERLKEAAKLGFSIALIPKANAPKHKIEGLTIIAVERIDEALNRVREHE